MKIPLPGLWGVLVLAGNVWAILQISQSSSTNRAKLFWIMIVLLLPVAGLIAWFALGPRAGRP